MTTMVIDNRPFVDRAWIGSIISWCGSDGEIRRGVVKSCTSTVLTVGPMFAKINPNLRKRRARYRRGREAVRPRHRRSR